MLTISTAAMHLLKDALQGHDSSDVFRLIVADHSIALKVAAAEEGDVIYEEEGVAILAAPVELAEGLDSQKIDVEETEKGPRLIVVAA